jgi:hypothetical protein
MKISNFLKITILLMVSVLTLTNCSEDELSESEALKQEIITIRDNFISELDMLGLFTSNVPLVSIRNLSGLVTFDAVYLTVPEWKGLSTSEKDLYNSWANQAADNFTGEQFFKKTYNWFMVVNELGHYVQSITDISTNGSYATKFEARNIAVAFWKIDNREELDSYMVMLNAVLDILPAPENTTETYYNTNFYSIVTDPVMNTYFQFLFIRNSYDNIDNLELNMFL